MGTSLVVEILECMAIILVGAVLPPRAIGWVVTALGVLALLLVVVGGIPVRGH